MNTAQEISNLTKLQKVLLTLLAQSGSGEDELTGTFLLPKENATEEEMEDWGQRN